MQVHICLSLTRTGTLTGMDHTSQLLSLGQYPSAQNIASILQLPSGLQMGGSLSNSGSSLDHSSASLQPLLAYQFQQHVGSAMLQPSHFQQSHSTRPSSSASLDLIARASLSAPTYQYQDRCASILVSMRISADTKPHSQGVFSCQAEIVRRLVIQTIASRTGGIYRCMMSITYVIENTSSKKGGGTLSTLFTQRFT